MHIFNYNFLKFINIPSSFISMTSYIAELQNESVRKKVEFPTLFTRLQSIAIVQSIKTSNQIEGLVTSDKRIKEIIEQDSVPLNQTEQEITGYRDALKFIHENYSILQMSEEMILNLHSILLSKTNYEHKGQYKKKDNIITERFKDGTTRIRFKPVKADETSFAMEQLVLAFLEANSDPSINKLLLIPCFILDFLCIHPFEDGNGRMSRLLTLLLLYNTKYDIFKYISFEEQINKIKDRYYYSLKESSINWHENKNDYIPFIENFIFTLYLCYLELDKRFLTLKSGKVSKTKRIEEIILNSFIPISKKEIYELVPDVSISTIEAVLSRLIKENKIIKLGSTINAKYFKNM